MIYDVFSVVDVTIEDHKYESIKYMGKKCESSTCYCAVSSTANSLISAVTDKLNPVGYFIVTISDILNPIEYANGEEPNLIFIRSYRNEVFKNGDITFVCFSEENMKSQREIVEKIYELVKPKEIIVLDSKIGIEFTGKVEENKVYYIGKEYTGKDPLPSPNAVTGISASLMIESYVHSDVSCTINYLCESSGEPTIELYNEWIPNVLGHIKNDIEKNSSQWTTIDATELANCALYYLFSTGKYSKTK